MDHFGACFPGGLRSGSIGQGSYGGLEWNHGGVILPHTPLTQ